MPSGTEWYEQVATVEAGKDAQANARLIAAAPTLLEIAKAYHNLLRTSAHTDGQVATFEHISDVIEQIEG